MVSLSISLFPALFSPQSLTLVLGLLLQNSSFEGWPLGVASTPWLSRGGPAGLPLWQKMGWPVTPNFLLFYYFVL
jgi:hypothetical protein